MSFPVETSRSHFRLWLTTPRGSVAWPLVLFGAVLAFHLWPQWTTNPDLSHGFFAPIVFALLVREGVLSGTPRWLPDNFWTSAAAALAALVALASFSVAGLLAASLGWSHATVEFSLAATLVAFLFSGLLVLSTDRVRAVPFNWPVLTGIGLWLLAAPIPPGTYARLTMELQAWVTSAVLHSLHILGVPALQSGNVIQLATTSVGVEEACSGIRSLISCVYAGCFFAGWLVRGFWPRAFLIVVAPLLAIAMNFIRSLALTLLANRGVSIAGFWHDATGFAILGCTALILGLFANWLSSEETTARSTAESETLPQASRLAHGAFLTSACAVAGLALFFAFYQRPSAAQPDVAFDRDRLLPAQVEGWQVVTADDLYRFADILQTQHLAQRTYWRQRGNSTEQVTIYVAHWAPGQAPVSMVASHTPDACWPGSGWVQQTTATPQLALALAGTALPPAEYRFFVRGPAQQHVWYWHVYDGRVINYRDPYSVPALLEIALRYGFRREGSQYFVRISSNVPWQELALEPLLTAVQNNLGQIGLRK